MIKEYARREDEKCEMNDWLHRPLKHSALIGDQIGRIMSTNTRPYHVVSDR